ANGSGQKFESSGAGAVGGHAVRNDESFVDRMLGTPSVVLDAAKFGMVEHVVAVLNKQDLDFSLLDRCPTPAKLGNPVQFLKCGLHLRVIGVSTVGPPVQGD